MTLVAVVGDGSTTTAVGLAAVWPSEDRPPLIEVDPAGGSLAAWLDLPRSPGLADVVATTPRPEWDDIRRAVQRSESGLDVILAPAGALEASAVVQAATKSVIPVLAALETTVIADGGRLRGAVSALTAAASLVVIAHRQHTGSAAAAALGLERVAELVELHTLRSIRTVVALVGERPYGATEVAEFVRAQVVPIAVDAWAAAAIAGRVASSARLRRSPLMRSIADLADAVAGLVPVGVAADEIGELVEERA